MKKTAIALAVALAGLTSVAHAAPQEKSWYAGGKVGWSRYTSVLAFNDITGFGADEHLDPPNQIGAGAFLGYQYNRWLGFELGYDWLGEMNKISGDETGTNGAKFFTQGVQLTTKLTYPFPFWDKLDMYTRLGGMIYRSEAKFTVADVTNKNTDTGVAPLAAIGLEYDLNDRWSTRLDYQYVWRVGDKEELGTRPDNNMVSLGVSYNFGSHAAPIPIPIPIPSSPAKHVSLKSDVLFNFNKATFRPEGHAALDRLYRELSGMGGHNVIVIGHTDRLGSDSYNQQLSEQRAQSVANYLIAKGIPASSISAKGVGKSNPVSGSKCVGIQQRSALISCLAPDRRVEVSIDGKR